jgi:hypothetical protein
MVTVTSLTDVTGLTFAGRRASCLGCHYSGRVRANGDLAWHRLWFGWGYWNWCPGARREVCRG